jgi:hypothetical protein
LTLANPDLEANLFQLEEIDFAAATNLARTAVEHAALADKARVARMELARQTFIVPVPASGEVRWTVDVTSGRESVQVFADASGGIIGKNIDGTERAKSLDILRELDLAADAARAAGFVLGRDPVLTAVSIGPRAVGFETGTANAPRLYLWNLNGLQRAPVKAGVASARPGLFSVDDVDWTALPKIAAAARSELAMPQGRLTGIELTKPPGALGPPIVLWKLEVTDQNQEKGYVLFDGAGAMRQVLPPQSRRAAIDWFDPKTMTDALARLAAQMGRDRQFAEITFLADKVVITAQDAVQPNAYSQVHLTTVGFERAGAAAMAAAGTVPFKAGDLQPLTQQRLADLERRTLAILKIPPKSISAVTIGRNASDPSPRGNVTIEVRAADKSSGRIGRVIYELDGTVVKSYLPEVR